MAFKKDYINVWRTELLLPINNRSLMEITCAKTVFWNTRFFWRGGMVRWLLFPAASAKHNVELDGA